MGIGDTWQKQILQKFLTRKEPRHFFSFFLCASSRPVFLGDPCTKKSNTLMRIQKWFDIFRRIQFSCVLGGRPGEPPPPWRLTGRPRARSSSPPSPPPGIDKICILGWFVGLIGIVNLFQFWEFLWGGGGVSELLLMVFTTTGKKCHCLYSSNIYQAIFFTFVVE